MSAARRIERPDRSPWYLPLTRLLANTTVNLVLLTFIYYMVPVRFGSTQPTVGRLAASLLALAALTLLLRGQVLRSRRLLGKDLYRIQWLLSVLYMLVLGFALVYAVVAAHAPQQFAGLSDRTDALYFSVTVAATVGFGDIHAHQDLAELLVVVQMLFDLIYLGTALRVLGLSVPGGGVAGGSDQPPGPVSHGEPAEPDESGESGGPGESRGSRESGGLGGPSDPGLTPQG